MSDFVPSHPAEMLIELVEYDWLVIPRTRRYRGSGTVWHDAETGRRAKTPTEYRLNAIWNRRMWARGNPLSEAMIPRWPTWQNGR